MRVVPINAPEIDPNGLNAWEKLRRCSEVAGSPSWAIKGFDAVSRNDKPLAITKSAHRKYPYCPIRAAGQNRKAPTL